MPIYTHYPIRVRYDDYDTHTYRCESLQAIHAHVLRNFTRNMSCSTDDIIDVKYLISSIKDCRSRCYNISALTIYVSDGYSYTFTREYCPDADGLLSDISYASHMDLPVYGDTDFDIEWDWAEHRVIYQEVTKLPKRIKHYVSLGLIEGDINISVAPVKSSFVKQCKKLIKIDRRRKVPEIYKEWLETINYYPVELITPIAVSEPLEQQVEVATEPTTIDISSIRIGWSDDEW